MNKQELWKALKAPMSGTCENCKHNVDVTCLLREKESKIKGGWAFDICPSFSYEHWEWNGE